MAASGFEQVLHFNLELASHVLQEDYGQTLQAAIAAVPTITEIGMTALLPGIDSSAEIIAVGPSKLGLQVGNTVLKDRAGRVKFLEAHGHWFVKVGELQSPWN